jgi:hypothetical protein
MPKHRRKRRPPKRSLALPGLEQAKSAVLNSLTSKSRQRTYDHAINEFVDWYCSGPRGLRHLVQMNLQTVPAFFATNLSNSRPYQPNWGVGEPHRPRCVSRAFLDLHARLLHHHRGKIRPP